MAVVFAYAFLAILGVAAIISFALLAYLIWTDISPAYREADSDEEWRKFKQSFSSHAEYEKWLNNMVDRDIQRYKECRNRKEHE